MYHGVWNKRQSIERKKLCSLAQCSSFCFQVCLKTRNPFLKFSFVLGNKAAYLENYHSVCTVKLANTSKRTKYINIKFEIKFEYLLSKKQHLFNQRVLYLVFTTQKRKFKPVLSFRSSRSNKRREGHLLFECKLFLPTSGQISRAECHFHTQVQEETPTLNMLYFSGKCRTVKSTHTAPGRGAGTQNRPKATLKVSKSSCSR